MMIRPNAPNYAAPSKGANTAPPAGQFKGSSDVSGNPSDAADINFNAPAPTRLESLLAATAADAAELEGNIGDHKPGELIVRTRGGFSLADSDGSVVSDFGARVIGTFDTPAGLHKSVSGEFLHIQLPAGVSVEQAMAAMARDSRVEFAVPNHTYTLPEYAVKAGATNDPDLGKLWGLHNEGQTGGKADADIDAPEAWTVHTGRTQAQGAHITAVIDTGIDYNHPDLKANMWVNPGEIAGDGIDNDGNGVIDDVHGYNAFADNGDPLDGQGHGTHCAGTIAGVGNDGQGVVGVNQSANLMAVKIFSDEGSTDAAAIIRGIQYATKMGARITSNSWGGPIPNAGIRQAFADSPALHLVAAGNSGTNNDYYPSFPANYTLDNIISVAATDHNDGLADFSQFGARSVDLGAPGVDILSTVPGGKYDTYSGTSMATPHVAGAATLIASHQPDISNEQLRARLLDGADKVESLTGKTVTGGRLNVNTSLTMNLTEA
jgi:subtilisin family serine protease